MEGCGEDGGSLGDVREGGRESGCRGGKRVHVGAHLTRMAELVVASWRERWLGSYFSDCVRGSDEFGIVIVNECFSLAV